MTVRAKCFWEPIESEQMWQKKRGSAGRHFGESAKTGTLPHVSDQTPRRLWDRRRACWAPSTWMRALPFCAAYIKRRMQHYVHFERIIPMYQDTRASRGMKFATGLRKWSDRRVFTVDAQPWTCANGVKPLDICG